jgi:hypothetical protein
MQIILLDFNNFVHLAQLVCISNLELLLDMHLGWTTIKNLGVNQKRFIVGVQYHFQV